MLQQLQRSWGHKKRLYGFPVCGSSNAHVNVHPTGDQELRIRPPSGRQHSFIEINHEIFLTVILSLPLIQGGQLSVSGERMCTILVNCWTKPAQ